MVKEEIIIGLARLTYSLVILSEAKDPVRSRYARY